MKIIIVGGVAGGATAAARARRLSEDAEIILFERGYHVSYANCGLPYYIGGEIEKRDDLFVATPERLERRYRIQVRRAQEVLSIDRENKCILARNLETGERFSESYDYLILSPGATSVKPPIPGIDQDGIYTMKDLPDTDRIKSFMEKNDVSSVLIVGGGFIGLEAAENISRLGIRVAIVELQNQLLPPLDYDMSVLVHQHLRDQGIQLVLGQAVQEFRKKGRRLSAVTDQGVELDADLIILSMGISPETTLAEASGLAIGETGAISVDHELQSSDPSIFAVGDVIEVPDFVSGKMTLIPLAGPANRQGRAAADNVMGRHIGLGGCLGTSVVKAFDIVAASTGSNEKRLKQLEIPYRVSFTHSFHHATYYPEAKLLSTKLIFSPEDGRILGAQVIGQEGVDKRIDILAVVMQARMTVYDLQELQLAYSPQFGSAKDPINIAGYVASNILSQDMAIVHWHELDTLDTHDEVLLDVRDNDEVIQTGTIGDALHIYIDDLREHLSDLNPEKTYICYCTVGMRAYLAYRILVQSGFKARILSGGYVTWYPIQEEIEYS